MISQKVNIGGLDMIKITGLNNLSDISRLWSVSKKSLQKFIVHPGELSGRLWQTIEFPCQFIKIFKYTSKPEVYPVTLCSSVPCDPNAEVYPVTQMLKWNLSSQCWSEHCHPDADAEVNPVTPMLKRTLSF
jgi:hypothetical protein